MKYIIGIDEVGRGPLAGPVTVCACIIPKDFNPRDIFVDGKIKDSKKLKKDSRNNIYQTIRKLRKLKKVDFTISSRSAEYVDKNGISKAIKSCIKSVLNSLELPAMPAHAGQTGNKNISEDFEILLDGSLYAPEKYKNQKTIIKGDEKEISIAMASIIAKYTRDLYMEKLSIKINNYDWQHNMGYGTAKHMEAIKKYGLTKYHRKTYIK